MRRFLPLESASCAVMLLSGAMPLMAAPNTAAQARLSELYCKLPLSFEANAGQADGAVKFLARGGGADDAFVTDINATGAAIVYSTFLGGRGQDVFSQERVVRCYR